MLTSPDGNGILFLFWKVKALAKKKKIQWTAGNSS